MNETGTWEAAVAWLIAQPDKQDFVRACYFDQPTIVAAQRYSVSEEWAAVQQWLPSVPGSSLDVGAGNGIVSYALAKSGWKATALEPDPSDLVGAGAIRELAKRSKLEIEVIQEFGEGMPFADNSFDLVYARQVMHHARDLSAFCREVARVLAPEGVFIGSREHVISSANQLPAFLESHPLHRLYGGENSFTLKQYLQAMKAAGLRITRIVRPFDSPMNYAPQTKLSLARELTLRLKRIPLGFLPARALASPPVLNIALRLLSRFDRRPGRVFSFIAFKPKKSQ